MSDNEFFSEKNVQYPPDMVGEIAELAYKYNANTMKTNIVVSMSIGTMVDVIIFDLLKDGDATYLYKKHIHRDDYAGIAQMLQEVREFVENLHIQAQLAVVQP